jgi:hypothetical protein
MCVEKFVKEMPPSIPLSATLPHLPSIFASVEEKMVRVFSIFFLEDVPLFNTYKYRRKL